MRVDLAQCVRFTIVDCCVVEVGDRAVWSKANSYSELFFLTYFFLSLIICYSFLRFFLDLTANVTLFFFFVKSFRLRV